MRGKRRRGASAIDREVIRTVGRAAASRKAARVVLCGNLAPDGAVIKQTAASPHLLQHRGPAYVFETYEQMRDADRQRWTCRSTRTRCW